MAYKSRKKKQAQTFKTRFRIWGTLALIVSVFAGLYYFSRYEPWQITLITFEGDSRVDIDSIEKDIFRQLDNPWWQIIATSNKFFYPKTRIRDEILRVHPLVKDVKLRVRTQNTLIIIIEERGPEYVLCEENKEEEIDNGEINDDTGELNTLESCVFVDITGLAYEKVDQFLGHEAMLIYREKVSTTTPYLALTEEENKYFEEIHNSFEGVHHIHHIIYRPDDTTDVFLEQDFYIKFTKHNSVKTQLKDVETGLGQKIKDINFSLYEYIDARFPGKIYLYEKRDSEEKIST